MTIRPALPADREALARLAALDSQQRPEGPVLVAEVAGELWAAVSLEDAAGVADPFRPSAELLLLLHARARQLRRVQRRPWTGLRRRVLPATS